MSAKYVQSYRSAMRRVSLRLASFTVVDASDNVYFFEQIVPSGALKSPLSYLSHMRRLARTHVRNAIKSATVQIAGREELTLV